jgi:hypothetical protein
MQKQDKIWGINTGEEELIERLGKRSLGLVPGLVSCMSTSYW